jgi:hypothetical protein
MERFLPTWRRIAASPPPRRGKYKRPEHERGAPMVSIMAPPTVRTCMLDYAAAPHAHA